VYSKRVFLLCTTFIFWVIFSAFLQIYPRLNTCCIEFEVSYTNEYQLSNNQTVTLCIYYSITMIRLFWTRWLINRLIKKKRYLIDEYNKYVYVIYVWVCIFTLSSKNIQTLSPSKTTMSTVLSVCNFWALFICTLTLTETADKIDERLNKKRTNYILFNNRRITHKSLELDGSWSSCSSDIIAVSDCVAVIIWNHVILSTPVVISR